MVPTSCSCSGPTAAHVAVALSGQPRWCGSVGPCAATQSVKRESTASSGGASPSSGSDGSSVLPPRPQHARHRVHLAEEVRRGHRRIRQRSPGQGAAPPGHRLRPRRPPRRGAAAGERARAARPHRVRLAGSARADLDRARRGRPRLCFGGNACAERDARIRELKADAVYADLRGDSRFQRILKCMNLE